MRQPEGSVSLWKIMSNSFVTNWMTSWMLSGGGVEDQSRGGLSHFFSRKGRLACSMIVLSQDPRTGVLIVGISSWRVSEDQETGNQDWEVTPDRNHGDSEGVDPPVKVGKQRVLVDTGATKGWVHTTPQPGVIWKMERLRQYRWC